MPSDAAPAPRSSPRLRGHRPARIPVWFMRQAGRSLPEYRAARAGMAMLDACLDPALAAEITLQPVRRHGVDAAVFFSDIVVPLPCRGADRHPSGRRSGARRAGADRRRTSRRCPHRTRTGGGRRRRARAVAALGDTPLIGFAGAPFTLACYLVEGGRRRTTCAPGP